MACRSSNHDDCLFYLNPAVVAGVADQDVLVVGVCPCDYHDGLGHVAGVCKDYPAVVGGSHAAVCRNLLAAAMV